MNSDHPSAMYGLTGMGKSSRIGKKMRDTMRSKKSMKSTIKETDEDM